MKKVLILTAGLFLSACSTSAQPKINHDPNVMQGMPCHEMGGTYMGDCKFDEDGNVIINEPMGQNMMESSDSELFSQETDGLPKGRPSEVVKLNNGDTYEMVASMVKQEVGNRVIKRLAYNGMIPGPLLRVSKNAEITVNFKNNLDVDTTIHSHGLRLDNEFDGVSDVTQPPIQPGDSFTYKLKFPDEGVYWYHPHIREDYTQELGLYGNFLVDPESDDYWNKVDREEFLILDDIFIDENQPAFPKDHSDQVLMGRFGNIMLINNEEEFTMKAKKNEVVRLYITNVANTRHFNLAIPGAKLKLVGGDVGRIEHEQFVEEILIAPAERYIVEALFEKEGPLEIQHITPKKTYIMGAIFVEDEIESDLSGDFSNLRSNSDDYDEIRAEIDTLAAAEPDKKITLSIDMPAMEMGMMAMDHQGPEIEWEDDMPAMNRMSTSEDTTWQIIDEETKDINMDINWDFKRDDLVKVRIFNDPESMHPMQHPIHFHGQRFLVLSRDGEINSNLQWKDTALVVNGETMDILIETSNPGTWMAHCHIAEHLHSGMMMQFNVN